MRARFAAVGAYDSTVRVLSLANEDCLQTVGVQALAAAPASLLMLHTSGTGNEAGRLYLNAGLAKALQRPEVREALAAAFRVDFEFYSRAKARPREPLVHRYAQQLVANPN